MKIKVLAVTCHGYMTHICHMTQIGQNKKCHWTSHLFWSFNDNPMLSHNDNAIMLSLSTKLSNKVLKQSALFVSNNSSI